MLNQQLIDWPAVISRLDNVSVASGVSPMQQLNNLLDALGRQVLLDARSDSTNRRRNMALHFGLSCVVVGAEVLSKQLLESHVK